MLSNTYFKTIGRLGKTDTSVQISKDNRGKEVVQTNVSVVAISDDKATIEQMKVTMIGGTMTILNRGLDNSESVVSDPLLKKDRGYGTKVYITALAPDIVSPNQTNSFSQKQTFTDIDVSGTAKVDGKLQVNGKYQGPVVADITARDLLYPAPVSGNEVWVTSLNSKQVYNGGTSQWESLGISTPVPDATKLVKGIVRLATDQEAIDGTIDTVAVTPKQMSKIDHLTESIFMVGETVAKNDSLFPENMVTFAGATEIIEFGKTTADKRVVMYAVGDGVASNKIKLGLKKFGSPSVDVSVRIETVDGSGIATGTLVNANAYGTTLTSGLTTTSVDTEITLNGSITIPKGTNVAVIVYPGTLGSETINATNYFGIASKTQVVRSFGYGLYNASYTNYTNKMVYFSSDLLASTFLSKTSAIQHETLPTDYPRITQTAGVRGQIIPVTFNGLHSLFVGLIKNTIYYTQDTAGMIGTTPGTKKSIIGVSKNSDTIKIGNNHIIEAGDSIIYSNIVEVGTFANPVYGGIGKTYISPYIGRVNISFEGKTNSGLGDARARIYVNGIGVGIERTLGNSYVVYTEEINVYYNDLIEIRYGTPGGQFTNIKNFFVYGNILLR